MSQPQMELQRLPRATPASSQPVSRTESRSDNFDSNSSTAVNKVDEVPPANQEAFDSYPDGGEAWLQVMAGFAIFMVSVGGVYTWGVIQEALVESGLASSSTIVWIGSTQAIMPAFFGILCGRLVSAFGSRQIALAGVACLALGPLLGSFCTKSVVGLALTEGVIFGIGQALAFFSSNMLPSHYFKRKRNVATGIVYAGGGIGGAVLSIIAGKLLTRLSVAWTLRVLALIYFCVGFPAALTMKSRAARQPFRSGAPIYDAQLLRSPAFYAILFGTAIAVFPLFVPPFFLPLYATSIGLSKSTSSYLLAGFNLASAAGRIGFGVFADARLGSLNSLILCLFFVAISTLAIWPFATSVPPLVIFSVINGFCAGGMFSLVPGVVSSLFGSRRLGVVFAMLITSWTPGYLLGSPIAGFLLEASGGPDAGIKGFKPAIFYSGGLSALSTLLVSVPKIMELRQNWKKQ